MRVWGMWKKGRLDLGHHGPLQDGTHPFFLGTRHVLSSRPRHTVITICPSPSLIPGPTSYLGLQWTPSPCPHPPRPLSSLLSYMSVCTPSSPPHPPWADPAFPGSPDIPECPTPLAQEWGSPGRNQGLGWLGGEEEKRDHPILLKQGLPVRADAVMGCPGLEGMLFLPPPLPDLS